MESFDQKLVSDVSTKAENNISGYAGIYFYTIKTLNTINSTTLQLRCIIYDEELNESFKVLSTVTLRHTATYHGELQEICLQKYLDSDE